MEGIDMKATDLMCGDWVLINGTPRKIQAIDSIDAEIQADDDLYYVGEDRYHSEDKIEGIPLADEIIKKNGFKEAALKEPNTTNLVRKWWSKHGEIYIKEYYLARSREIAYVVGGGYRMRIENIYMVHQLQHSLRLCGLDELADNLKI